MPDQPTLNGFRDVKAPDGFDLPKAAVNFINQAAANRWSIGWLWEADMDGHPYLTVHAVDNAGDDDPAEYFKYTWHSKGTGTLRLFGSGIHRRPGKGVWEDAPSLKQAISRMRETEDQRR